MKCPLCGSPTKCASTNKFYVECEGCTFSGEIEDGKGEILRGFPQEGQDGFLSGEEYTFFDQWGWLRADERFELKRNHPRIAP